MNKEDRDYKRRQKALGRVRSAAQLFENEINKAERFKGYDPDLEDLEDLARYFEGCAKCIKKINTKALRCKKISYK